MQTTRALTVQPGIPKSLQLEEFRIPGPDRGSVLVRAKLLGVCGTDRDIIAGKYGTAPPGHKRLILGHESLGRVIDAPPDAPIAPGDFVIPIVRHPDPVPCDNCAVGEWDMCTNGQYTEHGIKALDGFGADYYRMAPEFLVKVDPSLGDVAVLTEPTTILAKAWDQIERIGRRAHWNPKRVLVTGAGPVGLLAALLAVQRRLEVHVLDHSSDGPKPTLARELGATYYSNGADELPKNFDIVVETTAAPEFMLGLLSHTDPNAIVCLLGVTEPGKPLPIDIGGVEEEFVLGNRVLFGSVNANRRHYEAAHRALGSAPRQWLERLITRRAPLAEWQTAFDREHHEIKTIIEFESS